MQTVVPFFPSPQGFAITANSVVRSALWLTRGMDRSGRNDLQAGHGRQG